MTLLWKFFGMIPVAGRTEETIYTCVWWHIRSISSVSFVTVINHVKKVKMSLCLTKHHAMRTYWGSGSIAPRILNLGTRWRWVVSLTHRPLYPEERTPGTHWVGGWVGPRTGQDAVVKKIILSPRQELNPGRRARSQALYRLRYPTLQLFNIAHTKKYTSLLSTRVK
jgi:hypothetical protein